MTHHAIIVAYQQKAAGSRIPLYVADSAKGPCTTPCCVRHVHVPGQVVVKPLT
jgi:hypothetical protein